MKLQYYPETDSLYIDLNERPGADSREIQDGVVLDFDAEGLLVEIDIDNASKVLNLDSIGIISLPASTKVLVGA